MLSPKNDNQPFYSTLFCHIIAGIFAILKAIETRDASNRGDMELAQLRSREAKRFATWALVAGIVLCVITVILTIIYVVVVLSFAASASTDSNYDY